MRPLADRERIERLIRALGHAAEQRVRIYLLGGTTAVLLGWRATTVDVDFVMRPEDDAILRAIPALKETLQINVETASPLDFIPIPSGWEDRGIFIERVQHAEFYHFDLVGQAPQGFNFLLVLAGGGFGDFTVLLGVDHQHHALQLRASAL